MIRLNKTIGGVSEMWGTVPTAKSVSITDSGSGNDRDVIVVATTDDIDLDNEVVLPGGADLSYFQKNGEILIDHNSGVQHNCGVMRPGFPRKIVSGGEHRGWEVRFRVDKGDLGDMVLEKFRTREYGVSIGFDPINYGPPTEEEAKKYPGARTIVRSWKWIELSVTPVPCNPSARGRAVGSEKSAARRRVMVLDGVVIRV